MDVANDRRQFQQTFMRLSQAKDHSTPPARRTMASN
jgi:hypothetical protein